MSEAEVKLIVCHTLRLSPLVFDTLPPKEKKKLLEQVHESATRMTDDDER